LGAGTFPHDIGTLGRYGRVFDRATQGWASIESDAGPGGTPGLAAAGLSVIAAGGSH